MNIGERKTILLEWGGQHGSVPEIQLRDFFVQRGNLKLPVLLWAVVMKRHFNIKEKDENYPRYYKVSEWKTRDWTGIIQLSNVHISIWHVLQILSAIISCPSNSDGEKYILKDKDACTHVEQVKWRETLYYMVGCYIINKMNKDDTEKPKEIISWPISPVDDWSGMMTHMSSSRLTCKNGSSIYQASVGIV